MWDFGYERVFECHFKSSDFIDELSRVGIFCLNYFVSKNAIVTFIYMIRPCAALNYSSINVCGWKTVTLLGKGPPKMENMYYICHKVSQFVSNYTVCLEKGHLPFSEWWTWLLNLRQGTAPSPAWRSANTTRWARNVPQGNNFGRHVVRRRTQSGRGKGETEGIGGQGQGALGHSG